MRFDIVLLEENLVFISASNCLNLLRPSSACHCSSSGGISFNYFVLSSLNEEGLRLLCSSKRKEGDL